MESGTVTTIAAPPAVSAEGGATAATPEETATVAADAVDERAEHMTIAGPIKLEPEGNVCSCKDCGTHLGLAADIISKAFYCKHGKSYLFNNVVNVTVGVKEDRMLITGMHTISDIFCVGCGHIIGWTYEAAHEKNQKYKEGNNILERYMLSGPDDADDVDGSDANDV